MSSVDFKIDADEQVAHVHLAGEITETADFAPVLSHQRPQVILDLEGIKRINSCGVREWINFINALNRAGSRVTLEKCSVPIVNQLNMISNFKGGGDITSIFAPYYCEGCDQEHFRLVDVVPEIKEKLLESVPCPQCARPMEFDELLDSFLGFTQ